MANLTKTEMAQVVVQALYNMPEKPASDHHEVVRRAKRGTRQSLSHQHQMAMAALRSVGKAAAESS